MIQVSTTAHRPKQRRLVRERTDLGLGVPDLQLRCLLTRLLAQRPGVGPGMVADPVAAPIDLRKAE